MAQATSGSSSEEHDKQHDSEQENGKKERQGSIWSDIVTVITENTESLVRRHKIFETSDLFRTACSGNWIEARERTVILDHIPARYFALYVELVYNKSLPCGTCCHAPLDGWIGDSVIETERSGLRLHFWCQFWIFADFLGDKRLMEFCLRAIKMHVQWRGISEPLSIFLPATVELLLNETPERSDLQECIRMLGDGYRASDEWWDWNYT